MKTAEFFNQFAEEWFDLYERDVPKRAAVAVLCGAKKGSRVLDIGCGPGVMFNDLLEQGVAELYAVDVSDKMIECAKEMAKNNPNVHPICIDLFDLKEGNFDVALMYCAYPHFTDRKAMLSHVSSLLKAGGRFTIAHPVGKEMLNKHHSGISSDITSDLNSAVNEAKLWEDYFVVDSMIDTQDFYMISGTRK